MVSMVLDNETFECENLQVLVENIQDLSEDEYALARRKGLGASDSSILLKVNPYKDVNQLVIEKRTTHITDAERAIKEKDAVRKGFDLEPLILEKYAKLMECPVPLKPASMYQIVDAPYLTVNFDGITNHKGDIVPVECKFVTTYGDKYYNKKRAFKRERGDCMINRTVRPYTDAWDRVTAQAEACGIPPYYYTQIQQQIFALNAPFGFLNALHDKGWEDVLYFVPRDDECIRALIIEGAKVWNKINK